MIIVYSSNREEKILNNERKIRQHYGKNHSELATRLAELRAVNSLSEVPITPPPCRHKLSGRFRNCWGIRISKNYRIVIEPCGDYNLDNLETIKKVKIISIEDYH
ncbi:plasmid maintenance system killer protein [Listeria monocytogenes]|nr:plasmid maintenance system killer protein [Listeria monocytogenes]EAG9346672.1 plasmid maintenance system killer protein [Listeria monocytogenes]